MLDFKKTASLRLSIIALKQVLQYFNGARAKPELGFYCLDDMSLKKLPSFKLHSVHNAKNYLLTKSVQRCGDAEIHQEIHHYTLVVNCLIQCCGWGTLFSLLSM